MSGRSVLNTELRRQVVEWQPVEGLVYRGPADFVLRHGRWYEPEMRTNILPGHCYAGALLVAGTNPPLRYVEGFALDPWGEEVIPHAWVAHPKGRALEITWRKRGAAYLGVEFSVGRADDCSWNGDASVLLDKQRGWPLFRRSWRGEDWNREWPSNIRLELLEKLRLGTSTIEDYMNACREMEDEIADG